MAHTIILDNTAIDQMVSSLGALQTAMNAVDGGYEEYAHAQSLAAHECLEGNETFLLGDLMSMKGTVDSWTASFNEFL